MNEANQNANSFDAEAIVPEQSPSQEFVNEPTVSNGDLLQQHCFPQITDSAANESSTGIMNWQRVAHKLREYNRKLLKKVNRLEEELAEIDNKFNKYVEKSRNSDVLLAQQAEELESYQEKVTLLMQQLAGSQQQIENQELLIKKVSEQHELSLQQTAQLERECTLLQEKYNQKAFELATKEQESQKLQSELSQQQHSVLQQEAKLKSYQEAESRKEKAVSRNQNYPHNRFIQPWSTSIIPEPKIAMPKNKSQSAKALKTPGNTVTTIKTAAEIASWSASSVPRHKAERTQAAKTSQSKKPQSLAAIDLPTFPRPQ
jgi:predicted  nucleic acid-binding Zn-ribbon protein